MHRLFCWFLTLSFSACASDGIGGDVKDTGMSAEKNICENVEKIREFPLKLDWPTQDASYNALRVNPQAAKSCLIDLITDTSPMVDPRSTPTKFDGFVVGDLAFFLLSRFNLISFEDVLPDDVREDYQERGYYAYVEWIQKPGSRIELQARCRRWTENHSSKRAE